MQWLKDGKPIAGATATSYTTTTALNNAGNYTLKATNVAGTTTSETA